MQNTSCVSSIVILLAVVCLAVSTTTAAPQTPGSDEGWFGAEMNIIQKVYDDCTERTSDISTCLKGKALAALSKAGEMDSIKLVDGIALVRNVNATAEEVPVMADARTLNELNGLDRALVIKLDKFLNTHVLKVEMNEARGKKEKKFNRYIVAALLTAMGIAGPLGLKALAAIAGKALVISKVALTIAGIIALKKIFSSDHHEETSFQVHAGEHNRRNTYLVRPVKPNVPNYMEPYRYYYEQYPQATQI